MNRIAGPSLLASKTSRSPKFTIYHALAASLVVHAALVILLAFHEWVREPEEQPVLVIELQGLTADAQTEQKLQEEMKSEAKQAPSDEARPVEGAPAKAPEPDERSQDETGPAVSEMARPLQPAPAAKSAVATARANNVKGAQEFQVAHKLDREAEIDRLRKYAAQVVKKVNAHLVYPEKVRRTGMQVTATVSFVIQESGQIRPEALKIVGSSGQPTFDASALKAVRASVPFDPPPREMTVAVPVGFVR